MTTKQTETLRKAVYAIADAHQQIKQLNEELKAEGRWAEQGDAGRLVSELDDLEESVLGYYLKKL